MKLFIPSLLLLASSVVSAGSVGTMVVHNKGEPFPKICSEAEHSAIQGEIDALAMESKNLRRQLGDCEDACALQFPYAPQYCEVFLVECQRRRSRDLSFLTLLTAAPIGERTYRKPINKKLVAGSDLDPKYTKECDEQRELLMNYLPTLRSHYSGDCGKLLQQRVDFICFKFEPIEA